MRAEGKHSGKETKSGNNTVRWLALQQQQVAGAHLEGMTKSFMWCQNQWGGHEKEVKVIHSDLFISYLYDLKNGISTK